MNQFFIPRPFSKPPKAMEVLTILELQDETRLIVFHALFLKKNPKTHIFQLQWRLKYRPMSNSLNEKYFFLMINLETLKLSLVYAAMRFVTSKWFMSRRLFKPVGGSSQEQCTVTAFVDFLADLKSESYSNITVV